VHTVDLRADPSALVPRPAASEPLDEVRAILSQVREGGDAALVDLTLRFDRARLDAHALIVPPEEVEKAGTEAEPELLEALEEGERRIRAFSQNQLMMPWREEIGGGTLGEVIHAVDRAGIYAPGGAAAYPSTVLMCAVPASVAGAGRIALCVPPGPDGRVPAATLAAAHVAGVDEVYRVGGAQAIGALAFGTETVPRCDVVAGPGNAYVALAKREVAGIVGIDSVAGPSEIAILTDGDADPRLVAFDLVAQAEHGPGGTYAVFAWEEEVIERVRLAVDQLLGEIEARESLRSVLEDGTVMALAGDRAQAVSAVNRFAPEHLEILCEDAESIVEEVRGAGAIFIGPFSPVSLGDYLAGSNHVLPTGGAGRWASGLRASHFQRATAVVWYDRRSLNEARDPIRVLAEAEGLPMHWRAVEARFPQDRDDERPGA
jgi:histidinol dehydrogenase